jgi:hypothetical protein
MSRAKPILKSLIGTERPDDLMTAVRDVLSNTTSQAAEVGNIYTFVYFPKTPGIRYDAHPLVAVTGVYSWGFSGINFHWGEPRQYTYEEMIGPLYNVNQNELGDLRRIPFGKIKINN